MTLQATVTVTRTDSDTAMPAIAVWHDTSFSASVAPLQVPLQLAAIAASQDSDVHQRLEPNGRESRERETWPCQRKERGGRSEEEGARRKERRRAAVTCGAATAAEIKLFSCGAVTVIETLTVAEIQCGAVTVGHGCRRGAVTAAKTRSRSQR